MELNYFKDHLFDLINESNILNVRSIIADDKENVFRVVVYDGSEFCVKCADYPAPNSSSIRP